MDKALVFRTKDCRLESCQDQGSLLSWGASVPRGLHMHVEAALSDVSLGRQLVAAKERAPHRQHASVGSCMGTGLCEPVKRASGGNRHLARAPHPFSDACMLTEGAVVHLARAAPAPGAAHKRGAGCMAISVQRPGAHLTAKTSRRCKLTVLFLHIMIKLGLELAVVLWPNG